jgi:hypothetical protein
MTDQSLFGPIVYALCFFTSAAVMLLLLRSYKRSGSRLVLWSGLAFVAIALNHLFLFVDLVLLPESIDLRPLRDVCALAGVGMLIYSFVWKGNRP